MKKFEITSLADILKPEKNMKSYISRKVRDIIKKVTLLYKDKIAPEDKFEYLYKQIRLFIIDVIARSYCHPKDEVYTEGDKPKYILDAMTESIKAQRNRLGVIPDNYVEAFLEYFIHTFERIPYDLSTPMKYWVWRSDRDYAIWTERYNINFDNSDILTIIEMTNDREGDPDNGFDELVVKIFEYGHRRPYYENIRDITQYDKTTKSFRVEISSKFFNTKIIKSKYSSTYWSSPISTEYLTVSIKRMGSQYSIKIEINNEVLMEI
jgi:hypothetical protein